ncbi:MAG: precorrin-6A/cobalt-precorrin-6A reductase, partial [Psychromonas sp.]
MKILIVGGTADGRHLASVLHDLGFELTYSIAGIVRKASLPCAVVSGGFSQFGGLQQYLLDNLFTHIFDVTHPFAQKMSDKIAQVSAELSLPAIRFQRAQWQKMEDDQWIEVTQWDELIKKVRPFESLFITAGQVKQHVIDQ